MKSQKPNKISKYASNVELRNGAVGQLNVSNHNGSHHGQQVAVSQSGANLIGVGENSIDMNQNSFRGQATSGSRPIVLASRHINKRAVANGHNQGLSDIRMNHMMPSMKSNRESNNLAEINDKSLRV